MKYKQAPWDFVEKYYLEDLKERNTPETKFYLSWMEEIKGKKVLCLGCGPNLYDDLQFFKRYPEEIVGIDINKENINFLKKSRNPELIKQKLKLIKKRVKIKLIKGNILKKRNNFVNKFDTIYATGVVGMFEEKQLRKLLKILYDYLKEGGTFLDVDWTDCQLTSKKYEERKSFEWYSNNGPSIKKIGKIFRENKFKVLKHRIYRVKNKKEYGWGKIYGYLVLKK